MNRASVSKHLKGSGIIVVILAAIAFSIYAMSTFSEQEHFSILQQKYEQDIVSYYEQDYQNAGKMFDQIYQDQYKK